MELPTKIQLLDTAELCMRAAQVITRHADDPEAVQLAAAPIIGWATAWQDRVDADARRKAVRLVLNGMGRALETSRGTRIQTGEEFTAAAEAWRHTLMSAATVPEPAPGYEPPAAVPAAVPGAVLGTSRVLWLVRTLLAAAFTTPAERDRLVALAVRYGRTSEHPPTSGEYATVLAYLFRHYPRQGTPEPFLPGTSWLEAMDGAPGGTQPDPPGDGFPAGWREPPTGPQRNLAAYGDGTGQDGGGAP